MKAFNVVSGTISKVTFNEKNDTLRVEYTSGSVYEYAGVPEKTVNGLVKAASVGKYLNEKIKGTYNYKKVRGAK